MASTVSPPARAFIAGVVLICLPVWTCAALTNAQQAQLRGTLTSPQTLILMVLGVCVIAAVGIWISALLLGMDGGFARSIAVALIAGVLGLLSSKVLRYEDSYAIPLLVGIFITAAPMKFIFDASWGRALACSVLSIVIGGILIVLAMGIFAVELSTTLR